MIVQAGSTKDTAIRRQVLIGTFSNTLAKCLMMGIWFFLTPFILRQLGDTQYGLWALVGSVVTYGTLLDFGMGGAVIKYIAEHRVRGNWARAQALIATVLWLYCGLGLLAILASIAIAPVFPLVFRLPPEQQATAYWLVVVMGLNIGISIPCAVTSSVLKGLQRYDITSSISTLFLLFSASATVCVLLLGGDVVAMVAVNIPTTLALQIPTIWAIKRVVPELNIGWRGAKRELAKQVVTFSTSLFINEIAARLQTKTDEIVIGIVLTLSAVTPYAIARKLSESAQLLTEQFLKVLLPIASSLHAEDDQARLKSLYLTATRLTLAIYLPIAAVLILFAPSILTLWVGEKYAVHGQLVAILTVAGLINVSQWPAAFVLQGMERHRLLGWSALGNGIANLVLSLMLARPFGLIGIALGTLIPMTIESFGVVQLYAARTIGISLGETLRQVYGPALLPLLPTVLVLVAFRETLAITSLLTLSGVAGIGVAVYGLTYLALGAGNLERDLVRSTFQRFSHLARTYRARL